VQILEFHRDLAEKQGEFSGGLISRHARTLFRVRACRFLC
jgi:hypothetical protein